jgi:hypothetical protein
MGTYPVNPAAQQTVDQRVLQLLWHKRQIATASFKKPWRECQIASRLHKGDLWLSRAATPRASLTTSFVKSSVSGGERHSRAEKAPHFLGEELLVRESLFPYGASTSVAFTTASRQSSPFAYARLLSQPAVKARPKAFIKRGRADRVKAASITSPRFTFASGQPQQRFFSQWLRGHTITIFSPGAASGGSGLKQIHGGPWLLLSRP